MTGEVDDGGGTAFQFLAELLDCRIHIGMSRILRINHVKTASLQKLSDRFRVCNRRTDRRLRIRSISDNESDPLAGLRNTRVLAPRGREKKELWDERASH
jgi:hypothetical protein